MDDVFIFAKIVFFRNIILMMIKYSNENTVFRMFFYFIFDFDIFEIGLLLFDIYKNKVVDSWLFGNG